MNEHVAQQLETWALVLGAMAAVSVVCIALCVFVYLDHRNQRDIWTRRDHDPDGFG